MPIKNPPHPGDFIRTEIIQPAGLSVTAAAAALRVSRPALSSLLNGLRTCPPPPSRFPAPRATIRWRPSALVLVIIFVIFALFAPWIAPQDPAHIDLPTRLSAALFRALVRNG